MVHWYFSSVYPDEKHQVAKSCYNSAFEGFYWFLMMIVKLRTEWKGWPHNSCQRINKAAWLGEVFM